MKKENEELHEFSRPRVVPRPTHQNATPPLNRAPDTAGQTIEISSLSVWFCCFRARARVRDSV